MAFAELWLPVIGAGIFIAWAIGAWYAGSKILAIWLIFGGIVCLLLLGTLQWQHAIEKTENVPDETAVRQFRAYVYARPAHLTVNPTTIAVRYTVGNTGQTPASNIRHAANIQLLPYPLPRDFIVTSPDTFVDGFNLGKDSTFEGETVAGIGFKTDLSIFKNSRFYLVVVVKYEDTFKRARTTHLCAAIANLEQSFRAASALERQGIRQDGLSGNQIEFEYPAQHNDSD